MIEIVERQEALAVLADLRESAFTGRGGAALVGGSVALGKSALLDVFASCATEAGALTLTATASAEENGLQLGVLSQLLLGAPLPEEDREFLDALVTVGVRELAQEADAQEAAATAQAAAQAAAAGAAGIGTGADVTASGPGDMRGTGPQRISPVRARIADRFCLRLAGLSVRTPLAIVVDDVHHADAASLACLEYLVRRIRHTRIALVLAYGDDAGRPAADFRLNVLRQPHSRAVDLPPLGLPGVAEMLAAALESEHAQRVAPACLLAGGGNPLLTKALVYDQREAARGAEAPEALVGENYGRAVLACLRRGSPLMLAAARGVAVLEGAHQLERLLGLDAATTRAALRDLERCGLLADGRLRHPAAREAVLADLGPESRARLYAAAAEIAHTAGRPTLEVAAHLLAAGRADAPWAVPVLEEAARASLTEGSVTAAIGYLKLARDSCADQAARPRLTTMLVRAEWRLNPAVPAQHLDELLCALEEGRLAAADATVLARALLWHGRVQEAAGVFRRIAAGDLEQGPETTADLRATRAWLRSSFAPLLAYVPDAEEPDRHRPAAETTELRHRLGASAALDEVLTRGPSAQVVEEAERILRGARLESMGMDAVESALLALTYGEHPHRAAPWCDKLIEAAIKREAPSRQARLKAIRSEISVRQGDLPGGERHARAGLDIIPATSWGVMLGACLGSLLTALTEMGRHEEAAEALSRPVPEAMLESRYGLHYIRARGRYHLATDDPDSALADFLACGELMRSWAMDTPGLLAWRTDAAEAMLAIGAKDRARRLLEEQLERCDRRAYPRAHGNALRVLARGYELRQRPMLLRAAADALQESEDRYLLALTLCDLTTAYQELGESRRARVIGRQAWNIAQECHAEPVSRLLAAEGAHPETEPAGTTAVLSEAERRVAELVVQGHTNREIAKRLFITVSTVEQHLTHAYRKLGVTGRADLALVGTVGPRRSTAVAGGR